jgi:hypothetical protein
MEMTIEQLVNDTPGNDFKEKNRNLHSALLLAFHGALQSTVGKSVLGTPLFDIDYDTRANTLDFSQAEGFATMLNGHYSLSALNMIFACHLRDVPLVLQGDTGVGKTLTTESYFEAMLPEDSYIAMSLSHQSFTDSPKAPFEESRMENGMPVTYINRTNLRRMAGMYVDEMNLGNVNDLLQLSYGRVMTSTERGIAGIEIPDVEQSSVTKKRIKRTWVSGSQNPPQTEDAQFSGLELTASLQNRFLQLTYPSIVQGVGTTMWYMEEVEDPHQAFKDNVAKRFQQLTSRELSPGDISDEDWLDIYAFTTDKKKTEKALIVSAREYGDLLINILGGSLQQAYAKEAAIVDKVKSILPENLASNYSLSFTIRDSQEIQTLNQVLGSMGKPFTERDNTKMKDLADLFATLKSIKGAYRADDPLQKFTSTRRYITVEDVAESATLLLRNKQKTDTEDPLTVVNQVLKEYVSLVNQVAQKMRVDGYTTFSTTDTSCSIKHFVYSTATETAPNTEKVLERINTYVGHIKSITAASEITKMMVSRTVADLSVLSQFLYENKTDLDPFLQGGKKNDREVRQYVRGMFQQQQENPEMRPVYQHRLPKILF